MLRERSDEVVDGPATGSTGAGSRSDWPWSAPGSLWQHALVLAVVLVGLVCWLDNGSMVSGDEGAVLSQVRILDTTGSWTTPNRSTSIDPTGKWFPIDLSDRVGDRFLPYGKHPAYPEVSLELYRVGGLRAILFGSAFGTLAAAVFAALLARRLSPRLDIPTLWTVGLLSPLLFDATWVIAHSLAAALVTAAVFGAVRVIEDGRRVHLVTVSVALIGAVLLRTEALVAVGAIGVVAGCIGVGLLPGVAGRRSRTSRFEALAVAAVAAGSGAMALIVDHRWFGSVSGGVVDTSMSVVRRDAFVAGRVSGVWNSLLRPQMVGTTPAGTLAVVIAVVMLLGALAVRRSSGNETFIRMAAAVVIACSFAVLLLPVYPVPGLFVAFPLLGVGLALLGRRQFGLSGVPFVVGVVAVYSLGVIITQHSVGGSTDWGGRYFHLVLPSLVPVLLLAVADARHRLGHDTARRALAAVLLGSIAMGLFAVRSSQAIRTDSAEVVAAVRHASELTASAHDPAGPVVVCNAAALGRRSWEHVLQARYLMVPQRRELVELDRRLTAAGVSEFLFVDGRVGRGDTAAMGSYRPVPGRSSSVAGWQLHVMRRVGN